MGDKGIVITVSAETAQALQKLDTFFKSVSAGMDKVVSFAKPLAGLAAAFMGLKAIEETTRQVLQLGSELKNLQARTGGAIQDLVLIERQLREAGGAAGSAGMLLNFMQRSIVQAAEEGGAAAKLFNDLHLSVSLSQLSALSATEQYKLLGSAIAAIENPAKRAEATLKLFGRGGGDLAGIFSDPKKFQAAFSGENPFGQVMARSSETFHEIEVSLDRLSGNGKKLMAGVLDEVAWMFSDFFKKLSEIDLTALGQRLGGFVAVVVQAWRDDKFPEMVGLLIEAGFEIGILAAQELWRDFLKTIGYLTSAEGGSIWVALLNGLMTFGVKATEFLLTALISPVSYMAAAFDWLYDRIILAFQKVGIFIKGIFVDSVNVFASNLEKMLNGAIEKINSLFHAQFGLVSLGRAEKGSSQVNEPISYSDALARNSTAAKDMVAGASKYLNAQLEASRSVLGINTQITAQDNLRLTALQRLNALIDEQIKKRAAQAVVEKGGGGTPVESRLGPLRELERLQKEKLLELDKQLVEVESSIDLTAVEKWEKKKALLEQQRDVLKELVKVLRERASIEDATTAEQTLSRADTFEKQGMEKGKAIGALGADPRSFSEQFTKTLTDLRNQWGTWATQIAGTFSTVFNKAISSISSGITDLIMGTKTWGQALLEIGRSIVTTVIQSIVEMGVRWVMTHVIMRAAAIATAALMRALGIAQRAESTATGASSATAGVGTAGQQGGWVGIILYMAVLAAAIAAVAGMFAEGGRPPVGQLALVGERGPELFVPDRSGTIIPAHVTAGLLRGGTAGGSAGGGPGGGASGSAGRMGVSLAIFDDPSKMAQWTRGQEFETHVVDLVKRNIHLVYRG